MFIRYVPVQCVLCHRIFELDEFDVEAATKRPDGRPYVHCLVCLRLGAPAEQRGEKGSEKQPTPPRRRSV